MTRYISFGVFAVLGMLASGCGKLQQSGSPTPPSSPATTIDLPAVAKRYAPPEKSSAPAARPAIPGVPMRRSPAPLGIAAVWVPSGWMGDALPEVGALSYRVSDDDLPADEWTYIAGRGQQRWAAVAYQYGGDLNFGDRKGKDLSGKGYARLTFKVRAKEGTVRVVFKSGGCTTAGARFPASYESVIDPVSIGSEWKEITIPLAEQDLSNVSAALVIVFTEQLCPRGGTLLIRDAAFRGPPE